MSVKYELKFTLGALDFKENILQLKASIMYLLSYFATVGNLQNPRTEYVSHALVPC